MHRSMALLIRRVASSQAGQLKEAKVILEEAMADLSMQLEAKRRLGRSRQADAIKLGIEALKRLQEHRTEHVDITYRLLPGETKG